MKARILFGILSSAVLATPQQQKSFHLEQQQQWNEFQSVIGQFSSLFPADMANASLPVMDEGGMRCWKSFRPDGGDDSCALGYEFAHGRCYVPCATGYKAWGQFCFAVDSIKLPVKSYERDIAPAKEKSHDLTDSTAAAISQCPSAAPFNCGLICTDSVKTCRKEGVFFALILVKFSQVISSGNFMAAIVLAKQLFDRLSHWPKCKELGDDLDLAAQLQNLLHIFG